MGKASIFSTKLQISNKRKIIDMMEGVGGKANHVGKERSLMKQIFYV